MRNISKLFNINNKFNANSFYFHKSPNIEHYKVCMHTNIFERTCRANDQNTFWSVVLIKVFVDTLRVSIEWILLFKFFETSESWKNPKRGVLPISQLIHAQW